MPQSILTGLYCRFLPLHAPERSAGAGQYQPLDLTALRAALQALKNSGMLAVHRHDFRAAALRLIHNQLSGTNQCLLICQRDTLSRMNCRQRRLQTHNAHHCGHDRVRLRQCGSLR